MDITFRNEYCIVTDTKNNKVILAKFLTARVESGHNIEKFKTLKDIPIEKLKVEDSKFIPEAGDIYVKNGVVKEVKDEKVINSDTIISKSK